MNTPPQSPVSRVPSPPPIRRSSFARHTLANIPQDEDGELVLEENVPKYEVVATRTQPRVAGKLCIEVKPADSDVVEKWPLEAFVDEEGFFTDETVCKWVNDWNDKASKAPYVARKCLFCNRRAKIGITVCAHCENAGWRDIVYD
jgi:hypothetical protein